MKEKIQKINASIDEKRNRLTEKAERYFSAMNIPTNVPSTTTKKNTPPISYILYGVTGVCAVAALSSSSKFGMLSMGIVALASACGGYKISNTVKSATSKSSSYMNISSLKTEMKGKIVDTIKKTLSEWDEFMMIKQDEVRQNIKLSDYPTNQKDEMLAKIFMYETIDIKLSDFADMVSGVDSAADLKICIEKYKAQLIKAINDTAARQIAKYLLIAEGL